VLPRKERTARQARSKVHGLRPVQLTQKDGHLSEFHHVADGLPDDSLHRPASSTSTLRRHLVSTLLLHSPTFHLGFLQTRPTVPDNPDPPQFSSQAEQAHREQRRAGGRITSERGEKGDEQRREEFAKQKRSSEGGVECRQEVRRVGCRAGDDEDPVMVRRCGKAYRQGWFLGSETYVVKECDRADSPIPIDSDIDDRSRQSPHCRKHDQPENQPHLHRCHTRLNIRIISATQGQGPTGEEPCDNPSAGRVKLFTLHGEQYEKDRVHGDLRQLNKVKTPARSAISNSHFDNSALRGNNSRPQVKWTNLLYEQRPSSHP
jgi:hypothetical protein